MSIDKTAYLISCSDHYAHRLHVLAEYLAAKGYRVRYITSDFDHTSKQNFVCSVPGCVQLHARPYRKNLSLDRILSHQMFARDVFRYLERLEHQPDVIAALIPPNFLAYYGARYKKKHPGVYLIFDIFDMWPETFPFGKVKKLLAPVFGVWAWIRDHHLYAADFITTECGMFRELLKLPQEKSEAVYLCAERPDVPYRPPELGADRLDLCYLGAINNVIDIPRICSLIRELAQERPVTLHIMGKGERERELIAGAEAAGAETVFYGPVYEDEKKQEIISRCHFGLNIMKDSVCVGLTMKSVDYFRFGLPIINSIPADTKLFVEQKGAGIQCGPDCARKVLELSAEECLAMRAGARAVFEASLKKSVVSGQYQRLFDDIL